jgi:hypothetical protein
MVGDLGWLVGFLVWLEGIYDVGNVKFQVFVVWI